MYRFTLKLCKRDFRGNVVPGQYVTLDSNDANEIAEFYDKTTIARRGAKADEIEAKKPADDKQKRKRKSDASNPRLQEGCTSK